MRWWLQRPHPLKSITSHNTHMSPLVIMFVIAVLALPLLSWRVRFLIMLLLNKVFRGSGGRDKGNGRRVVIRWE